MKKLLTISLLTLAMVLLIVSCSAENNTVEDELAVISFDASENATRSLTRTNSVFNSSELYWYYTAEKKDSTGLTTGQTVTNGVLTKTAVNSTTVDNTTTVNKGLKPVGPFSYGDWEFVLYGCTEANPEKVAYKSEVAKITINKATTALKVFVTAQQTGSGTLVFPLYSAIVKLGGSEGGSATLGTDIVERITFNCLSDSSKNKTEYNYQTTTAEGTRSISLSSGSYSVTFSYLKGVTSTTAEETTTYDDSDAYAVAEETIYVSIKDNQVTTIGGDITEYTGEVIPDAVESEAKIVTTSDDSTTTVFYDSFLDAVEAYSSPDTATSTINVLKNVTISESTAFDKNLTIDLGNNILTLASDVVLTVGSSAVTDSNAITVTIKNGTIDGEGYLINDNYNASLKLENVTFAANRKSTWSGSKIADGSNLGDWFTTKLDGSLDTWSKDETNKTNATTYKNWFKGKFIDTGKAAYEESETKDEVSLTVYNADLFASYDLIYEYLSLVGYENWGNLKTANIIIDADLDLDNKEWTPISNQPGHAVLDFKNHTISNLKITNITETEGNHGTGIFKTLNGVTVKNLVITNATVSDTNGKCVGILTPCTGSNTSVQNVTIKNSSLTGKKYVGVIAGQWYSSGSISDCTVSDVDVSAEEQVGGIVGYIQVGSITGCTVNNGSTVTASSESAGGIGGKIYACNGKDSNVTVTKNSVSSTTVKAGANNASTNIGWTGNSYCGYVCGGKYINGYTYTNADWTTTSGLSEYSSYPEYPDNKGSEGITTIKDNSYSAN